MKKEIMQHKYLYMGHGFVACSPDSGSFCDSISIILFFLDNKYVYKYSIFFINKIMIFNNNICIYGIIKSR